MEKRAILAAILMAAILMVYQALFVTPVPEQRGVTPGAKASGPAPMGSAPLGTQSAPQAVSPPVPSSPAPGPAASASAPLPERTAVVDTPLYRAKISSVGGALVAWDLKYRGQKS